MLRDFGRFILAFDIFCGLQNCLIILLNGIIYINVNPPLQFDLQVIGRWQGQSYATK